jgi:hypothetical protein
MVSLVVVKELNYEQGEHGEHGEDLLLRMNLISNKKLVENRFFLPCWNPQSDRYS